MFPASTGGGFRHTVSVEGAYTAETPADGVLSLIEYRGKEGCFRKYARLCKSACLFMDCLQHNLSDKLCRVRAEKRYIKGRRGGARSRRNFRCRVFAYNCESVGDGFVGYLFARLFERFKTFSLLNTEIS